MPDDRRGAQPRGRRERRLEPHDQDRRRGAHHHDNPLAIVVEDRAVLEVHAARQVDRDVRSVAGVATEPSSASVRPVDQKGIAPSASELDAVDMPEQMTGSFGSSVAPTFEPVTCAGTRAPSTKPVFMLRLEPLRAIYTDSSPSSTLT